MSDQSYRIGTLQDVEKMLLAIETSFVRVTEWITKNKLRDERNLALYNLLTAAIPYIKLAALSVAGPTPVLAFSARSLYELCLRGRQIRKSPEALERWITEVAADHVDVLQGFLKLDGPQPVRSVLQAELKRIQTVVVKHGRKLQKAPTFKDVVRDVGDLAEYDALYKLFSKLVHPSSYLVNTAPDTTESEALHSFLTGRVQLYSLSLLEEIRLDLGVPDELVVAPGSST